jgi:two-component system sensor histidine kinase KdpD
VLESIDSRILNAMANMPRRSMILRYVVAVLASLAAAGIRFMIEPTVGRHTPYLPFVLAVIVVACLGGVGPTVLTTVTSGLVSSYFFLYPRLSFAITQPADIGGLVDFVVIATIINLLITQLRRSLMAQAEVNRKLVSHSVNLSA